MESFNLDGGGSCGHGIQHETSESKWIYSHTTPQSSHTPHLSPPPPLPHSHTSLLAPTHPSSPPHTPHLTPPHTTPHSHTPHLTPTHHTSLPHTPHFTPPHTPHLTPTHTPHTHPHTTPHSPTHTTPPRPSHTTQHIHTTITLTMSYSPPLVLIVQRGWPPR